MSKELLSGGGVGSSGCADNDGGIVELVSAKNF